MTTRELVKQRAAEIEKSRALVDSAPVLIRLGLVALKESIKTKAGKKKMRNICLEAFLSIRDVYSDDEEFQ